VKNKTDILCDHIIDKELDLLLITETWLTESDHVITNNLCPPNYVIHHTPWPNSTGGGVAIISHLCLTVKYNQTSTYSSFEHMEIVLTFQNIMIGLLIICRPPPSPKNQHTFMHFKYEFTSLLDRICLSTGHQIILGDFNIHMDNNENSHCIQFNNILNSFGLLQHVNQPTQIYGHTLDLIISRENDKIIKPIDVIKPIISDHSSIMFWLSHETTKKTKSICKSISY
jgi:exonuclease III